VKGKDNLKTPSLNWEEPRVLFPILTHARLCGFDLWAELDPFSRMGNSRARTSPHYERLQRAVAGSLSHCVR
jgi:hypothetical protein